MGSFNHGGSLCEVEKSPHRGGENHVTCSYLTARWWKLEVSRSCALEPVLSGPQLNARSLKNSLGAGYEEIMDIYLIIFTRTFAGLTESQDDKIKASA